VKIRIFQLKLNNDTTNIKDIMHCDYQTDLQAIIIKKKNDLINVGTILIRGAILQ
jgi:hypothetical protein